MIAREGIRFILFGLLLTVVFMWIATWQDSSILFVLSLVCSVLTLWTVFFFRDPERVCDIQPGVVTSPADGRVVAIENVAEHAFIGGPAVRISVFLSIFDVHVNRVPATGTIDYVKYSPGKFLPAFMDSASLLNEQTEIGMTASSGERLVFKQIAGVIARRVVCHLVQGDRVTAGARFGMIRFGSRADLIVSAGSEISVKVGDRVTAGETVLVHLRGLAEQSQRTVTTRSERAD